MRKELVWAGIIGISFGLIIGFGTWRVHRSVTSKEKGTQATPLPQTAVEQFKISLLKPNDFEVVTKNPFTVSGITKSNSWIIASTDDEDYICQSTDDGSFEIDVDLNAGVNHLKVTALNSQGTAASQKVLTVYSASFEMPVSDTGDSKDLPKSFIGTVTDISDSTIQIESTDSQIQQIATDKYDIAAVNTTGAANKTIKLSDVAIGDYIIAMGYTDGNDVLDAVRILVTEESPEPQINVLLAKVAELTNKSLDVLPLDGGEILTVTPSKNTWIASFSENDTNNIKLAGIDVDDMVIAVLDTTGSPSINRSLLLIKAE